MATVDKVEDAVARGDVEAVVVGLSEMMGDGGLTPMEEDEIKIAVAAELQDAGELAAAARILRELLTSLRLSGADTLFIVKTLDLLADIELQLNDANSALACIREAIELAKAIEGAGSGAFRSRLELMIRAASQVGDSEAKNAAENMLLQARTADTATGMQRFQTRGSAQVGIEPEENANFRLVSVHYGTHRGRTGRDNPYDFYGHQRAEMSYGKAAVSVPKSREVGTIERPSKYAEAHYDEYRFDPGRHFTIKTIDTIDSKELFIDDLTEAIDLSARKEALVFVHGYNTSFADALLQTAQLAVDLEIDGAVVLYSWPSRASLWSYVIDRNQVIGPFLDNLKDLIASVATSTGATRVSLIAHSMGGKFLLETLADLQRDHVSALADEIIFASPDVDIADFNNGIGKIRHLAPRITVYTSSSDRAVRLSGVINGEIRAGASAERVAASGADAIDTSSVAQGPIAHSDFATTALDDLRAVIWIEDNVDPGRRDAILRPVEGQWGRYWQFAPEEPRTEDGPFREALFWARRIGITAAIETASNMISVFASRVDRVAERLRLEQIVSQLRKLAP